MVNNGLRHLPQTSFMLALHLVLALQSNIKTLNYTQNFLATLNAMYHPAKCCCWKGSPILHLNAHGICYCHSGCHFVPHVSWLIFFRVHAQW